MGERVSRVRWWERECHGSFRGGGFRGRWWERERHGSGFPAGGGGRVGHGHAPLAPTAAARGRMVRGRQAGGHRSQTQGPEGRGSADGAWQVSGRQPPPPAAAPCLLLPRSTRRAGGRRLARLQHSLREGALPVQPGFMTPIVTICASPLDARASTGCSATRRWLPPSAGARPTCCPSARRLVRRASRCVRRRGRPWWRIWRSLTGLIGGCEGGERRRPGTFDSRPSHSPAS